MYHTHSERKTLPRWWLPTLAIVCLMCSSHISAGLNAYDYCVIDLPGNDTPLINNPPHLKPLGVQRGNVNQEIRIRLDLCDPEGEAPGTIAANMPVGATLPDNGDGTRSFVWTPDEAIETSVTFTVYEESDRSIRTSILVPFVISKNDVYPATSSQTPAKKTQSFAITLSSELAASGTSESSAFDVSGRIVSLAGDALPDEIPYEATRPDGTVHADGKLPVDGSGIWQGQVRLLPGHNNIKFALHDSQEVQTIDVTYNPGFSFSGLLDLAPDVAYMNEPRLFTARIALNDPQTTGATVQLVNTATTEVIARLSDDGNLANGDEIEADGVYSTMFRITANTPGSNDYQVQVLLADGRIARSESTDILITERLDPDQLAEIMLQQSTFEAVLVSTASDELDNVLQTILQELSVDPLIADVGISEGGTGIWFIYENGVAGAIYAPAEGTKGGLDSAKPDDKVLHENQPLSVANRINSTLAPAPYSKYCGSSNEDVSGLPFQESALNNRQLANKEQTNHVESSKVLAIAAQYWDWGEFDDVPQMQQILHDDECHDVTYKRYDAKGSGSVEDFKNLGDYGTILISSHGDSFYQGVDSEWQQRFGWNGNTGQVIVDSNMEASAKNIALYEDDLHTGRLVLWGTNLAITPSFISNYSQSLPNSLVYMSICRGTWNASMATAFLNSGAGTFLGYDNYVTVAFCQDIGPTLLNTLLEDGLSLQQAFVPEQFDPYNTGVVEFDLIGANDLSLEAGELQDTSFEQNNLSQAWQVDGDARLIQSLGDYNPTEGNAMAIISTGLGFTTLAGTLTQQICLCNGITSLDFDWNFLSEEWLEYVGSDFQDSFTVSLSDINSNSTVELFGTTINAEAENVEPVSNSFDQNNVFATGWRSFSGEIPDAFRGKSVSLQFAVSDIGDSIFDSAVLLDNVQIHCDGAIQTGAP